jgi:NADH-quinone oxidoreductase subunit J
VVWLATVFLLTAGIFILAGAEFLAVIQVLVYVGAVSVVILFGIMLTRRTLPGG